MKEVLGYLAKAEGTKVHRLKGEKNITAPYGIYRYAHPDAEIFKLIDSVAKNIGIEHESNQWGRGKIKRVNTALVGMQDKIDELAEKFYKEYLKPAHLELFPPLCKVAMFSMYINSPKNAWKAVQQSIIDVKSNGIGAFRSLSVVDGAFGLKTGKALVIIDNEMDTKKSQLYFEALMLFNMQKIYAKLAVSNPDKYLKFLLGWNNRMSKLAII